MCPVALLCYARILSTWNLSKRTGSKSVRMRARAFHQVEVLCITMLSLGVQYCVDTRTMVPC